MIDGRYAIDYQVHSFRSHDGRATIAEQCARAVEIGLDEIGFSEHKDFDPDDPVVDWFDYEAYMAEITNAREFWGDRLKIRAGVEIDYQKWFENEIRDFLVRHAFDFVIGSVHYVDRVLVMTDAYNAVRNRDQAYNDYFQAVIDSAASGLFDIIGHLEYANRRGIAAWGAYDPDRYAEVLNTIFATMIERGISLEINTAGLHQGIGVTYPTERTVELYAAAGGSLLSIGSDAHHPDHLAHAYTTAAAIALRHNFKDVSAWDRRRRKDQALGVGR